jgi:hypothetical protein
MEYLDNTRKEIIKNLYLTVLNREADEEGLFLYYNSKLTTDE